jgi:hypothetical protein
MSGLDVYFDRSSAGWIGDLAVNVRRALNRDTTVADVYIQDLIDAGIGRFSDNITAALRRGGFDVEDGEVLTPEKMGQIFEEQTGLPVDSITQLNADDVVAEIDRQASEKLSEALGFDVGSLLDADALARSIQDGIEQKISELSTDDLEQYLPAGSLDRLRARQTWERYGMDRRTVQNCLAQRKYRKSNTWTYD